MYLMYIGPIGLRYFHTDIPPFYMKYVHPARCIFIVAGRNQKEKEEQNMVAVMDEKKNELQATEDKRKETEEFMSMLRDMSEGEVKTIKGIMLGIKLSRRAV